MANYVLALDQGTTSSRAILFDNEQNILSIRQHELSQHYPREGWVEEDPMEIWSTQYAAMLEALAAADVSPADVAAVGSAKQRSCGTRPPAVLSITQLYGSAGVPPILWTASCGRG